MGILLGLEECNLIVAYGWMLITIKLESPRLPLLCLHRVSEQNINIRHLDSLSTIPTVVEFHSLLPWSYSYLLRGGARWTFIENSKSHRPDQGSARGTCNKLCKCGLGAQNCRAGAASGMGIYSGTTRMLAMLRQNARIINPISTSQRDWTLVIKLDSPDGRTQDLLLLLLFIPVTSDGDSWW